MIFKLPKIFGSIVFTLLIAATSPAKADKISNEDQDRLNAIGYADALVEACPKRFKFTSGAEARIKKYRIKHSQRIGAIAATELKGMNADPDVDCVGKGDVVLLDIRQSIIDGRPLLKDLGDIYAKKTPSTKMSKSGREYQFIAELCTMSPLTCKKSAKHPDEFVSPKQMIQRLKEPGMWDARHELVDGWACKNASETCEGGD
ncbi:hypothetical protein [Brucella sp. NBRC 12950]|uniref:hypothetical protein n=1 Tax=Brucella sp. NBRC 12950 TaxID=2994518 RepID=UPI0024A51FCB|nr:hypothetical protein [Brucella sp. NBRC 12950]GLU28008.1 hypothetical protein Brsp01_32410 [Brucella sp. NBRC 12950]